MTSALITLVAFLSLFLLGLDVQIGTDPRIDVTGIFGLLFFEVDAMAIFAHEVAFLGLVAVMVFAEPADCIGSVVMFSETTPTINGLIFSSLIAFCIATPAENVEVSVLFRTPPYH